MPVSINGPNDNAPAVVNVMERELGTTIATESPLDALRQELAAVISRVATKEDLQAVRRELVELRHDIALIRKHLEILSINMTIRLGLMLMLGLGLLFAALKLT